MLRVRSHAVGIRCAFDSDPRVAQVDVDDSGSSALSLPSRFGGTNLHRSLADLDGKQGAGRNLQMTVAVLSAPFEYLIRIPIVRTRNHSNRRPWLHRFFYYCSPLSL